MLHKHRASEEQTFDRHMKKHGGIATDRSLPEVFMPWLSETRDTTLILLSGVEQQAAETGKKTPIHVHFVHNGELNAVAFKDGEQYFVGINLGAILRIHRVFSALCCWPTFAPNASSLTNFDAEQPGGAKAIGEIIATRVIPLGCGRPVDSILPLWPRNSIRADYARTLALHAIIYLIAHEVGHVLGGHLEYVEHMGLEPRLWEAGGQQRALHLDEREQLLELDADSFALDLSSWLSFRRTEDKLSVEDAKKAGYMAAFIQTKLQAFHTWCVAVTVLHRLFDEDALSCGDYISLQAKAPDGENVILQGSGMASHPLPSDRLTAIFALASRWLAMSASESEHRLKAAKEAQDLVNEVWHAVGGNIVGTGKYDPESDARRLADKIGRLLRFSETLVPFRRLASAGINPFPQYE